MGRWARGTSNSVLAACNVLEVGGIELFLKNRNWNNWQSFHSDLYQIVMVYASYSSLVNDASAILRGKCEIQRMKTMFHGRPEQQLLFLPVCLLTPPTFHQNDSREVNIHWECHLARFKKTGRTWSPTVLFHKDVIILHWYNSTEIALISSNKIQHGKKHLGLTYRNS